jgi:hypothetical protein
VATSKKVASKASKALKNPRATKAQRSVAASGLAQTKKKAARPKKKAPQTTKTAKSRKRR